LLSNVLVPLHFGENDIFDQVDNPDGSQLRKFQLWMKQLIGMTPPAFYGRSLSKGVLRWGAVHAESSCEP
jgi:hypothetical protein